MLSSTNIFAQNIPSVIEIDAKETKSTSEISFKTEDALERPEDFQIYKVMPMPSVREGDKHKEDIPNADRWVKYDLNSKKATKLKRKTHPQNRSTSGIRAGFPGMYPGQKFPAENEGLEKRKKTDYDPDEIQKFSPLQQVADPTTDPYRKNVRLAMTFPNGENSMCSGTLIDYEWVMTAGHCIHKDEKGGWVTSIKVVPAYENGNEPFGNSRGDHLFSLTGWTDGEDHDYDIGWIRLRRPVGYLTGWYSFGYDNDDSFFKNSNFHNPGYPAESPYDGELMYNWSGSYDFKVFKIETYSVGQDRVGYGGQSGSGAYAIKNSQRVQYAVASHTAEDWNGNRKAPTDYTRITSGRFSHINDLMADERDNTLDLVALNVDAIPADPVEGTTLQSLKFHIANRTSDEQSGTWNFDLYLSDNKDISTADQLISSQSVTHTFLPHQLLHVNAVKPTIPIGFEGKKYLGVILKQSDLKTSNNDSDGWDAAELDIIPLREVTFKSENPDSDVKIHIEPSDIDGREDGYTEFKRRYPDDTQLELSAPLTVGTEKFAGWYSSSNTTRPITTDINYSAGARYRDRTIIAKYETPDIPVLPHVIGEIMPSYDTQTKSQELKIINKHSSTIYWDASILNNSEWLSINRTSGTTQPGETDVIEVIFDSSNLDTGDFEETIKIGTDIGSAASSFVPVRLRVGHMPGTIPTPDEIYQAHNPIPDALFGRSIGSDLLGGLISFGMPGLNKRTGGLVMYELSETGEFGKETLIEPGEAMTDSRFGESQALLSGIGEGILAVGAPGTSGRNFGTENTIQSSHPGQVYIFRKTAKGWNQQFVLQPDIASNDAGYGTEVQAVSIPGSSDEYILAVGVPGLDYETTEDVGAVFVYHFRNGELFNQQIIWPSQIGRFKRFGSSIEINSQQGQVLIGVGAPGNVVEEVPGSVEFHYLTERNWQLLQRIEANEESRDALFGTSLALTTHNDQPLIAVGAPNYGKVGGIFFYRFSLEKEQLVQVDSIIEGPEITGAELAQNLEMVTMPRYTTLMASAPGTNTKNYGGSAWLYQLNTGSDKWRFRSKLEPHIREGNVNMGTALAPLLIKDELHYITSAPGVEVDGVVSAGAAYGFNLADPATLPQMNLPMAGVSEKLQQGTLKYVDIPIQSSGSAELLWSLTETASWIESEIHEGSIPAGETQNLRIGLNATKLTEGQYNSDLILTGNDLRQDTTIIPVNLTVTKKSNVDLVVNNISITRGDTLEAGGLLGAGSFVRVSSNSSDTLSSPEKPFSLELFLSPDSILNGDDTFIASVRLDTSLQYDEQLQVDLPVAAQIPFGYPAGNAYLGTRIKYEGDLTEVDTTNNILIQPLWILQANTPQLILANQYRSLQVEIDEEVKSLPLIIQNSGVNTLEFSVPGFGEVSPAKTKIKNHNTIAAEDSIPAYLIDVVPATGDIAPGDSAELTLTMDGSKVPDGHYQDTLSLLTNDPANAAIDIALEITVSGGTYIEVGPEIPREYAMDANYPNPFNPSTIIGFALPEDAPVRLEVYNLLGRRVSTLVNEQLKAGYYKVQFDAPGWSSGIYFYRIQAGSYTKTRKMLLLK